jgi:alkylated DNA nucleotide flippase Atl1
MSIIDDVREAVIAIPAGFVASYGDIGKRVGAGPRHVGRAMSLLDDSVPWWRVVHADGTPASCHSGRAPRLLNDEGTPMLGARADMKRAATTGALTTLVSTHVVTGPQAAAAPQRGRDHDIGAARHGDHAARVTASDHHPGLGGQGQPVAALPAQRGDGHPVGHAARGVDAAEPVARPADPAGWPTASDGPQRACPAGIGRGRHRG